MYLMSLMYLETGVEQGEVCGEGPSTAKVNGQPGPFTPCSESVAPSTLRYRCDK